MDIKYKSEYEFLDMSGLDDRTKCEIIVVLNSGTATEVLQLPWDTGETEYYGAEVISEALDTNRSWQTYDPEQSQMSYEGEMVTSGAAVMARMPQIDMPYAHTHRQMMTPVYTGMVLTQPNMYEMGPEFSTQTYMQGMGFPHPLYLQETEIHEVPLGRENRRRGHHRGRGSKRDASSRYMDSGNEIGPAYHSAQAQYHRMQRNMCSPTIYYQTEHSNPQRQRSYYPSTTLYSPSSQHPVYNQVSQHPGAGTQYTQHNSTTPASRSRPELAKSSVQKEDPVPRPNASNYGPPPLSIQKKPEPINSPQTNIDCVTTVIVNNSASKQKLDNSVATDSVSSSNNSFNNSNNNNCSSSTISSINSRYSNNNKTINNNNINNNKVPPVNMTIEHNIVATVNKSCELSEKTDVPYVNINSSIQVKQKTENNVEFRKETVSLNQTNVPKTTVKPEPVAKIDEPQEESVKISVQAVEKQKESVPTPQLLITPVTRAAPESSPSWASILKKTNNEPFPSGITNGKPTARICPMCVDVASDCEATLKTNFSPNEAPGTRQLHGKPRAFPALEPINHATTASNRTEVQKECNNSSNKFNDLDAFKTGEFLSKYQMKKQTVSLLPRGLINRNNYCYINSILQALLACPPFYNLLMAMPYSKNTARNSTSNNLITNMIRFVHEFSPLAAGARLPRKDKTHKCADETVVNVQSGIAFEPTYVYTMLKNTSCASVFSVEGRQEDAEEFLSCLLNGISDEMLEMMKLGSNETTPTTTENEFLQTNQGDQEEWKIMGPKNKGSITRCTEFGRTPLSDIFRGQLRYRVSRAGEQPTDNVQPFFTLQLDIEKAESVKGALEILVGRDQLEGMTCSKTKREIEAWKQVTLEELPVILILHLKWFDYKLDGCSKILKSVEFPIDLKIDSKILSSNASKKLSPKQKQYKLFAVTYHDGKEATKGHYVTDAFHVGYGGWVRYDDSSLRGVSERNVLNPLPPRVPYLLYYRRLDTIGNNQLNNDRIR
ncbi:ubiquitin carboxyl-terminal hydrolase 10 [Neodiprion fabricii]|uniref:ubiquitin carboxyl-terminal hydrolase 10 n=1 Tax=Neodiprion fabricii TaxID=2872261 RepID=UPI001ED8E7B0|nr:ubiquitin carboxyl-terminal hydrolase 10 [Neodiprion fabricii]